MSKEVLLDLSFLTEAERDLISNVIAKDADIRKQEQNRIGSLRKDLDDLKENGLLEADIESKNESYCARCQTYFGILFNRGAYCPRCELKVCKVCRVNDIDDGWICTLCSKVREVKAQSGAWFFQGHKQRNGQLFGSMLVRQSLRRHPGSQSKPQNDIHSRYPPPKEEYDEASNPFHADEGTADSPGGNRRQSSDRLSGNAVFNHNHAQSNGGGTMGFPYSDDSDVDSEQGSHNTASDKTSSKGESESSESLDNDHDEPFETDDDHWSPMVTSRAVEPRLEEKPLSLTHQGRAGDVQQGSFGDVGHGLGISKDTKDDPLSLDKGASMEQKSDGSVAGKKLLRYTKSDEGLPRDKEKVRSRPTSLITDEDMSYVSAPRFDIPSKRRHFSSSEDLKVKPQASSEKADSESHRSRYEGQVGRYKENLDHQLLSDVTVESEDLRSKRKNEDLDYVFDNTFEMEKDNFRTDWKGQNVTVISEDSTPRDSGSGLEGENMAEVFGSGKKAYDLGSDLPAKMQRDYEDVSSTEADVCQPASKVELEIDEVSQDGVELDVGLHEVLEREQNEAVIESSPEIDREESSQMYTEPVSPNVAFGDDNESDNGSLTHQGASESFNTEQFDIGSDDFSTKGNGFSTASEVRGDMNTVSRSTNDGARKGFIVEVPTRDIPGNHDKDDDDDKNTDVLSVLSRIKNWETKSKEDRFGRSPEKAPKTLDISFGKDEKISPSKRYEISIKSSGNEEAFVSNKESTDVGKQSKDLSGIDDAYEGHLGVGDAGMKHGYQPEEVKTEATLSLEKTEVILQEELPQNDTSIGDISRADASQSDFTTDHTEVEATLNLEAPGVTDMEAENSDVRPDLTDPYEFPSEEPTSLNLDENNKVELLEQSSEISGTSVGNLGPREPSQSDSENESITVETSLNLEKSGVELQQESSDENEIDAEDLSSDVKSKLPSEDIALTAPEYESFSDDTQFKNEEDLDVPLAGNAIQRELNEKGIDHELSSETKSNIDINSSNTHSSFMSGGSFTASSPLKSDTFVDNEATQFPAKDDIGPNPFESDEDDAEGPESEKEAFSDVDVRPEISMTNQSSRSEPRDLTEEKSVHLASDKAPPSSDSRMDAMQAFSETFASVDVSMRRGESREDEIDDLDKTLSDDIRASEETLEYPGSLEEEERGYHASTPRDDRGYHAVQDASEDRDQSSQVSLEDRGHNVDDEEREYQAGQGAGGETEYHEDSDRELTHEYSPNKDHSGARADRGSHEGSEGQDSRRSSDLHYEGSHGDSESMISDTSGYYGTPYASEDTASKRTPSISGDDGAGTDDARRPPSESAPIIVTTGASDDFRKGNKDNNNRNSSITDYEEDIDVSFSKYGGGLGNRMLKDQLSMGSRESIVSYYSNAGGEVYGKYAVSGEIMFGIKYDPKIKEFQIQIHQARNITPVDKKSETSDPYVKTYLLPDRSRTGKRKSKVKKHTINPVFDEILSYKISYDEILQRTLWLAVWNHDTFGHNDFLGEVLVPIDQYHQSGFSLEDPEPQWYDLCERQADDPQLCYNGEIVFALKFVPPSALVESSKKKKKKKKSEDEKGELHVNIIEASNLLAKDSNGFSDPFCKSYLLPDKSKKTKQKTPVVKKSLNPKWNHHFVYENVTHEELMDRVLELTIWDFDRGSSNEFLGGVRLGLGTGLKEWDDSTSEEQAAWNKMLNHQNDWNQVTLILREHMGSHKSTGFLSNTGLDPNLVEIKPVRPPLDPYLTEKLSQSPDQELIRHHEYHSPHESKIALAMRLSNDKSKKETPEPPSSGARTMTLAELASLGPKNKERSTSSPTINSEAPRSSTHPSATSNPAPIITTPEVEEISTDTDTAADPLVRHSEFYKGSTTVMRRPSSDNQLFSQEPSERGGSTLSDLIQQKDRDNDSLLGSNLSVDNEWMGSRESIYSNDGVYGNNDVNGEISISYQYFKGNFKIKIFEARGLTAVDKTQNTSNPYVKVYLLPDQSRTGKRKTKMKYGTLDPEYNEEMLYKISTSELIRRTIWVSVWHYDRFGRNEFLGETRIPLGDYQGCEVAPDWYPLLPNQSKSSDNDQGQLVVALMYSPADKKRKSGQGAGKLYVKMIEARNLPGKDADGLSDPFCKSYLLPDPQKKSKRKTPVKKRNLNPRWDYKFTYDNLTLDELQHRVLELTVWDHDIGTSNDFLGGVRIGLGTSDASWDDCTGEEVNLWQFLLSKPNTWAESTLPLRSEMGSRKGLRT